MPHSSRSTALIHARKLTLPLEDLRVAHIADEILAADRERRVVAPVIRITDLGRKVRIFSSACALVAGVIQVSDWISAS